jgi:hypothetical protein
MISRKTEQAREVSTFQKYKGLYLFLMRLRIECSSF